MCFLDQGSPTPSLRTGTSPQPIGNQAAQAASEHAKLLLCKQQLCVQNHLLSLCRRCCWFAELERLGTPILDYHHWALVLRQIYPQTSTDLILIFNIHLDGKLGMQNLIPLSNCHSHYGEKQQDCLICSMNLQHKWLNIIWNKIAVLYSPANFSEFSLKLSSELFVEIAEEMDQATSLRPFSKTEEGAISSQRNGLRKKLLSPSSGVGGKEVLIWNAPSLLLEKVLPNRSNALFSEICHCHCCHPMQGVYKT